VNPDLSQMAGTALAGWGETGHLYLNIGGADPPELSEILAVSRTGPDVSGPYISPKRTGPGVSM
jgi:hypothetical protein